jgi:CheY-like chemotaxis protein
MLEDLGCEVITAASGNDALEKLSGDRRIEILITDINMPGMDGYQLAERATRMRGQLRVIMLAILSARPQTNNGLAHRPVLRAVTSGFSNFCRPLGAFGVTGFCRYYPRRRAFGVQSTRSNSHTAEGRLGMRPLALISAKHRPVSDDNGFSHEIGRGYRQFPD